MKKPTLKDKELLTPNEFEILFGISHNRYCKAIKHMDYPFKLSFKNRVMISQSGFMKYIMQHPQIKSS